MALGRSTRHNVDKAVKNLAVAAGQMVQKIHEKENDAAAIENQVARARVDGLNARALIDQLKDHYDTVVKEMGEKEALIDKYKMEIQQRHDEIEKKVYRVDRLNKKYDKINFFRDSLTR